MRVSLMRGVLLDRDGVINRERSDYVKSWDEFEFLPGVLPAMRKLAELYQPIVVITNQSVIGRGITEREVIDKIHQKLQHIVHSNGGRIDDFFVCPHHPNDGCLCRKPRPGLLTQAANRYKLDLAQCVFIGDSVTDYQAALAVGCQPIMVKSGRQGTILSAQIAADVPIADDLAEAVEILISFVKVNTVSPESL